MREPPMHTFSYSEGSITTSKQRTRAFFLGLTLVALPVTLGNARAGFIVLGTLLVICLPLAYIQLSWMSRHWRQMQLHVHHDGLMRESGTIRQKVPWTGITRVRMRHTPHGELRAIELFTASKQPMVIAGFEHMPEIARLIEMGVSPGVSVEMKHSHVALEHPVGMFAFMCVVSVAFVVWLNSGDRVFRETSGSTMQIGMGLLLLLYTPISRQNPNFRTMEVVLAGLMIGLALFRLVGARG